MRCIGVDVGGTFTHGVRLNEKQEVEEKTLVLTTHSHERGVAQGVIEVLKKLWREDVDQIAYSTTQVTNALLEGDLGKVGLVLHAPTLFSRLYFQLHPPVVIEAGGKKFVPKKFILKKLEDAERVVADSDGVDAFCISSLFSHESDLEQKLYDRLKLFKPTTAASFLSSLYGFTSRTRTALLNASLLPIQMASLEWMEKALREEKIDAPLLVMRSDGGALKHSEAKEKPLLTILSGPAAGVAAACRFLKVYQGVFVECGGTSTDISLIRDGRPRLAKAQVGNHFLHLRTLDIRTVAVAGGSLPRVEKGKLYTAGPRSAHIAGLCYASQTDLKVILESRPFFFSPLPEDPKDYLAFGRERPEWAITPSCCENYLRVLRGEPPLFGRKESLLEAFSLAEKALKIKNFARSVLDLSASRLGFEIQKMTSGEKLELVFAGGAAPVFARTLAEKMQLPFRMAPHYKVISAIGAAMGLIKESLEVQVPSVTEEAIARLKQQLGEKLREKGVNGPLEFELEVDPVRRKIYIGATAQRFLRSEKTVRAHLDRSQLKWEGKSVLVYMSKDSSSEEIATDRAGNVLLRAKRIEAVEPSPEEAQKIASAKLDELACYNDAGVHFPELYLFVENKLHRIPSAVKEKMLALLSSHLEERGVHCCPLLFCWKR